MQTRFRKTWSPRLGPAGVEEALRYARIVRRASLLTSFGTFVVCMGVALSNVPALCVGIVMMLVSLYALVWRAGRAQKSTLRAAAAFQGIDASLSWVLTLKSPEKFDSACQRATRLQEHRRQLGIMPPAAGDINVG